jgi:hypothetical protein
MSVSIDERAKRLLGELERFQAEQIKDLSPDIREELVTELSRVNGVAITEFARRQAATGHVDRVSELIERLYGLVESAGSVAGTVLAFANAACANEDDPAADRKSWSDLLQESITESVAQPGNLVAPVSHAESIARAQRGIELLGDIIVKLEAALVSGRLSE